jgi:transposase
MISRLNLLVDIPDDKGVHLRPAGAKGEKYVYKYVKYYRNKEGKSRNKAKSIGKFDPVSGKMLPNDNYFDMYHVDPTFVDILVWNYGYSYLVLKACRDMGLFDCLSEVFGSRTMDIVVMACFMIAEGNSMDRLENWQTRNYFPGFNRQLTSQVTSRIFSSITVQQRHDFFIRWVKKGLSGSNVCYDVTSFSSYAQNLTSVERGYNRDCEELPQFNLGMFCDEDTKIPLYYNRYNGSLTDRTNLSYVLDNAKDVGIHKVKMTLDGGFWSEVCFTNLYSCCEAFSVGMPAYLKEAEKLLNIYGQDIDKYNNKLPGHSHIYCVPIETQIYNIPGRVLIYYDSYAHVCQCDELSNKIDRLSAELATLKRYPKSKIKSYENYFIISKHEHDNGFDYKIDYEKVQKYRKSKGYFFIFTTDQNASPADILYYYRAKDADEKLFAQIKVDMNGRRIRTHNEETTDGKTFVTFCACAIRAYLLRQLSQYLNDNSTSLRKTLEQLLNITIIFSRGKYRFTKALTKKQKQILAAFNAAEDIFSIAK